MFDEKIAYIPAYPDYLLIYEDEAHISDTRQMPKKIITYQTVRSEPGRISAGSPFQGTGVKELKKRTREQLFLDPLFRKDIDDPAEKLRYFKSEGQWFDNLVKFDLWTKTNYEAEEFIDWFENILDTYTGMFKELGIQEMVYYRRVRDDTIIKWKNKFNVRSLIYFIRTEKYDGILISDYNKGLLTKTLMEKVLSFSKKKKIPVFVDPKVKNFHLFSPVTLVTPNHFEAEKIVHHECYTDTQVEKVCQKILTRISARYIILKRGEQGMTVFERGKKAIHIPTIAKEVFDVTGAGDTVNATAALALLSGASILEAAVLANTAAGIVVGKIGTATVTPEELINSFAI